jgi:hypothetical protein
LPQDAPLPPLAEVDQGELESVCAELQANLASADYGASVLMEKHATLLRAGLGPQFDRVAAAVADFDFDVATRQLEDLLRRRVGQIPD